MRPLGSVVEHSLHTRGVSSSNLLAGTNFLNQFRFDVRTVVMRFQSGLDPRNRQIESRRQAFPLVRQTTSFRSQRTESEYQSEPASSCREDLAVDTLCVVDHAREGVMLPRRKQCVVPEA